MSINVSCAAAGCTNPVIGQCPGYKGGCGRFYCAAHSTDGLCADCARRRLEDEIYEDYLQTAERLQRERRRELLPILIGLGIIPLLFFCVSINSNEPGAIVVGMVIFLGGTIWAAIRQDTQEKAKVVEISKAKPAFPEFYKVWKKEKSKEALMAGLAIAGVIVAGTIAGAVSAAAEGAKREERVSEIEEGIRRAMR